MGSTNQINIMFLIEFFYNIATKCVTYTTFIVAPGCHILIRITNIRKRGFATVYMIYMYFQCVSSFRYVLHMFYIARPRKKCMWVATA